jgi:hypothetical protein
LLQKNLKVECTAVKEAGVHSWHLQQPSHKYQEAADKWHIALKTICERQKDLFDLAQHQCVIEFMKGLWDQIADTSADPSTWSSIIRDALETAGSLQVQLDSVLTACDHANCATGFTVSRKFLILKKISEEMEIQKIIGSELSRKRPDGLVINWKKKQFFVLEFTRAYDMDSSYADRVENYKARKYSKLCTTVSKELGASWTGDFIACTTGVRGSVPLRDWTQKLAILGMKNSAIDKVVTTAITAALEQCHSMFQAREAALRSAHGNLEGSQSTA